MNNRYWFLMVLLSFCLIGASVTATSRHDRNYHDDVDIHYGMDGLTIEDINIDYDKDDLIIKNTFEETSFKITSKFELFVNNRFIETTPEQRELVKEMYLSVDAIIAEAKEIGWQGAKIGAEGAKLGLQAIVCVFKLLSSNYDVEDLEEEIERKAEQIEMKAELIEDRADELEDKTIALAKLSKIMKKEIPALQELSWF